MKMSEKSFTDSVSSFFFRIPAGKLNNGANGVVSVDKVCENIGIIEKVDVEMSDPNIWFVEEVVVEAPKDLSKPDEKSPVTLKVRRFTQKKIKPKC